MAVILQEEGEIRRGNSRARGRQQEGKEHKHEEKASYHNLFPTATAAGIAAAHACCCAGRRCRGSGAAGTSTPVGKLLPHQGGQVLPAPSLCCLLQRRHQLLRAAVQGRHPALCRRQFLLKPVLLCLKLLLLSLQQEKSR